MVIYYENGMQMQDSDGDILLDDRELWFDKDPFTAEDLPDHFVKEPVPTEYFIVGTDSREIDSDRDQISDYDEINTIEDWWKNINEIYSRLK